MTVLVPSTGGAIRFVDPVGAEFLHIVDVDLDGVVLVGLDGDLDGVATVDSPLQPSKVVTRFKSPSKSPSRSTSGRPFSTTC